MSYIRMIPSAVAASVIAWGGAAQADLSAEAVWQSWQEYVATSGQQMEAAGETRDASALVVEDVAISGMIEEASLSLMIDRITFDEQSDGTVLVTMSDSYTMRLVGATDETVLIGVSHPSMRLIASEIADGISYNLRAPEFEMEVLEFTGEDAPEELDVAVRLSGVTGSYAIPHDPDGETSVTLEARAADLVMRVLDEWTDLDAFYSVSGARMALTGQALAQMEDDPAAALRAGFALESSFGFDTARYSFDMEEWGSRSEVSGSSSDGAMRFVLNSDEIAFSFSSRNGELNASGDEIPFPSVSLTTRETGFGVALPLSARPEPQDVSLSLRVVDATVSDDVWDFADPGGALTRGPATIILDLVGAALLENDLFSEEAAMMAMMAGPEALGELQSLTLNQLLVRFAGAELTGEGAFTFDFDDFDTIPGVPRPQGVLELALRGGNTLLDSLVSIGAVADDEAMGARMMLALFTRPGDAPDELLSTIEVREDGAVLANGQRLQ
ncbi:hypothetical protein [Alkalilacustris brevis]|uniref:hypothetical protein n=1 Tax=Alkalilacustris brevis TaxID=2026338 RepID=UPI0012D2CBDA|nr:hypothetical protein [Alkalilacustris brevis]